MKILTLPPVYQLQNNIRDFNSFDKSFSQAIALTLLHPQNIRPDLKRFS